MLIELDGNRETIDMTILEAVKLQERLSVAIAHALQYGHSVFSEGCPIVINDKPMPGVLIICIKNNQ